MLNLILRVFAISAFLKVIHAPKTLKKPQERGYFRYPENNLPTMFFEILAIWTSHGPSTALHIIDSLSKWQKSREPDRSILGIFTANFW